MNDLAKKIPVVELYGPVVQGEGALCGQVSFFTRTAGCPLACSWCDSMHAVDPEQFRKAARYMAPSEIVEEVVKLAAPVRPPTWVTLSGGDPVIWDQSEVVSGLRLRGFKVAVETQATVWRDWLEECDLVTASPKPPSSGMADKLRPTILQKYATRLDKRLVVKVVVFDDVDLAFALRLRRWMPHANFYLSSGTPPTVGKRVKLQDAILAGYRWLTDKVLAEPELHGVTVLPQVHALLFGRELGR